MKSKVIDTQLKLARAVYEDACAKCPAEVSDLRDWQTIQSRVKEEGMSFLTITLPDFCKDFERSLAQGCVDPSAFRSFRKAGAIPAFLQGMLGSIFDRETGRLYDKVNDTPIFVEAVRQICLLFKKVEMQCAPLRLRAAIENFAHVEHVNSSFDPGPEAVASFEAVASDLWHNMLGDFSPDMLVPRHGPGATAERISGNQKFVWQRWYERLEESFPFFGTGISTSAAVAPFGPTEKFIKMVTFVQPDQEQPVRVVFVPKTMKTPRVIAIEPVCMQYAQQALRGFLYERVENYWLTRGHVNFTDQSINQKLALASSKDGSMATIDLSDASDRVPHDLAMRMFATVPAFQAAVEACRSTGASLPDGRLIRPLSKFASMGSALCFPVEAMYFYTICVVALLEKYQLPVTPRNIYDVTRGVYIYGDDMIFPVDEAGAIVDCLQKYNCKVNIHKSFFTGKFRESCGMDAYDGESVTPTYLRTLPPDNRKQAHELTSWIATATLFYLKGYWRAANLMYCTCEKIVGPLPYVSTHSSALGRVSFLGYRSATRWNDQYQSLELRALVPGSPGRSDQIGGYSALQKSLLTLEHRSRSTSSRADFSSVESRLVALQKGQIVPLSVDEAHLERTTRRGVATLKHRWVPVT